MKTLITGTAGFIGFKLALTMAGQGMEVIGLDNINDYYDVRIKYGRLEESGFSGPFEYADLIRSKKFPGLEFIKLNLEDRRGLQKLFQENKIERVCHLAAQAGVRYSLSNPYAYVESNLVGYVNLLECCRHNQVRHLVFASSSSVYGLNESQPFSTHDNVDHPISLYAATKKSNELMAHTYAHLYGLPCTGLRFFTVYGPWGRPDMALFLFTKAILEDRPIDVFNYGDMQRDFTYIDDIVEGVIRVLDRPPQGNPEWDGHNPDPSSSIAPYKLYNIGNNNPVRLMDFIQALEKTLGREAGKNLMPLQPGDVPSTYADVEDLVSDLDYKPETGIEQGIEEFVGWYRKFFGIDG